MRKLLEKKENIEMAEGFYDATKFDNLMHHIPIKGECVHNVNFDTQKQKSKLLSIISLKLIRWCLWMYALVFSQINSEIVIQIEKNYHVTKT